MYQTEQITSSSIFRRSLVLSFAIFLLTGSLVSGFLVLFYQSEIRVRLSEVKYQADFSVNMQSKAVDNIFDSIIGDLFFISRQNELLAYLANGEPSILVEIGSEYQNLSAQKKVYDQIRFLDTAGKEKVRVNYNDGVPGLVAAEDLQSKHQRYYFNECYQKNQNEVFISPFDLNIEHGKVELPFKPMIRLGTPVFDTIGQKRGIVLLNYLGSDLQRKLVESQKVKISQTMLLNSDGYWLLNPDGEQEWGFMFEDKKRSFASQYPGVWDQIKQQGDGQIVTSDGLFTFKLIQPLMGKSYRASSIEGEDNNSKEQEMRNGKGYHWHLVSFTPQNSLGALSMHLMTKMMIFGAGLLVIIAFGSWVLAFSMTKKRISQEQMKAMALYDALTGLPNRRLFYEELDSAISQSRRYGVEFGLIFIDLDGFKNINDTYGHESGDILLCKVADKIRNCLRDSDSVARLGGDEFVVLAGHLKTGGGEQVVARKIINVFSQPITLPQGDVHIGASIGMSLYPTHSDNADGLIRKADLAMYHSKQSEQSSFTLFSAKITPPL